MNLLQICAEFHSNFDNTNEAQQDLLDIYTLATTSDMWANEEKLRKEDIADTFLKVFKLLQDTGRIVDYQNQLLANKQKSF